MTTTDKPETKRDRVRRFVISPLQGGGMRFPHRMPEADRRKILDRICDELAYASDETLAAVAAWARDHGDGSDRSFFPPVVSFLSTAEAYEPRALEDVPAVASWFRSRAGVSAAEAGRLVAEFMFVEKKKRPPVTDADRKAIADRAREWGRDVELARDRIARGASLGGYEGGFLQWFEGIEARAMALVDAGVAARKAKGEPA